MHLNVTYLELDTLKQLPAPPSSVKLGCLTSVMPFEFSGRHSEVLPSYSWDFLHIILGVLTFKQTAELWSLGSVLYKAAVSS